MSTGCVRFVGCGPGAPDLLTLRAVRAIAAADIVVWSPSLLDEAVVIEHARPGAELVAWPPASQADIVAVYERAAAEGLQVVRLKGGDPTFFGELRDDLRELRARGVDVEVVPGVSAVSAGAAALCCEIAGPATPLVLAGAGAGAEAGTEPGVVGLLNTGRDPAAVAAGLAARGLAPATPCAVLVALSRPGEMVVTCTLGELAETLRDYGSPGVTTVLAGAALAAARCASED